VSRYAVDAWAWIEYLDGSQKGQKVKQIVEDRKNQNFTSVITLSEVVSKFVKLKKDPNVAIAAISALSKIVQVDQETAVRAGELHGEIRRSVNDFGLGDAYVLALAKKENLKILTGDPHFKDFKKTVFVN